VLSGAERTIAPILTPRCSSCFVAHHELPIDFFGPKPDRHTKAGREGSRRMGQVCGSKLSLAVLTARSHCLTAAWMPK
jgi:hypothetical protein